MAMPPASSATIASSPAKIRWAPPTTVEVGLDDVPDERRRERRRESAKGEAGEREERGGGEVRPQAVRHADGPYRRPAP
jgi:hypothetical protein